MQQIADNLPSTSGSKQLATQLSTKSLPTSTAGMAKQKAALLNDLIKQSFEVFHVYGRPPEAIPNMVKAFLMVLDTATIQDVEKSFQTWMRTRSVLPTPADILALVQEEQRHRRELLEARHQQPAKTLYRVNGMERVSWAGKLWGEYTDADRIGLQNHLEEMDPVKRQGYIQYLRASCGYPH